ncbi:c-di-GMP-binding flagellar brake protein YcgR [Chitinivorax tropicus]|uniref:Flagellar brake protein YcgR n=1 Tax=Chitinivorax tropicus TaxID=714531 RepID=A0A840MPX4_9PROT|nr:flagellar brake protein [Chitinivorax tropicus]MBB5018233.1 c-di-GMP-binding flagellar brake protein YcgR [Chitinivorax tropicus]
MSETTPPNQPAPITDVGDIRQFELSSVFDIAHALKQLMTRHDLVAVYFNQGERFSLTSILDVDQAGKTFIIDESGSPDVNRCLAQSDRNLFVATPEGIKHQFSCGQIHQVVFKGRPAFKVPFPAHIIKLQRREFFRLLTPIAHPITVTIRDHPSGKLDVPLHDLSLGGMCLGLTPRNDFNLLDRYADCTLDLPGFGQLRFGLEVRNKRVERLHQGKEVLWVGCQFLNLSTAQENQLQRYITQLQMEQKARG